MNRERMVVRDPLLDPRQQLLGYRFYWSRLSSGEVSEVDEARSLLARLQEVLASNEESEHPVTFRYRFYIPATADLLHEEAFQALPVANTGLIVSPETLDDEAARGALMTLRAQGFEILLHGADPGGLRPEWLQVCSMVDVHFEPGNFTTQARIYALLKQSSMRMAATDVASWQEYAVCTKLGLNAFVGKFYMSPPPSAGNKERSLNPSQATLLQLMEGVRANADIARLEELLKHDAAVSYKLLFYINSAAFGLSFEIESLRHAIQMLGYEHLYRWLCVLFATSDESLSSPVLLQAALIRGRLIELIGKICLSKADSENLFITGMFSMLDRLLGIDMEVALENIRLPEAVVDALIGHTGIYLPFLELALACETDSSDIGLLADGLGIDQRQVNQAHFEAIFWAQRLL